MIFYFLQVVMSILKLKCMSQILQDDPLEGQLQILHPSQEPIKYKISQEKEVKEKFEPCHFQESMLQKPCATPTGSIFQTTQKTQTS